MRFISWKKTTRHNDWKRLTSVAWAALFAVFLMIGNSFPIHQVLAAEDADDVRFLHEEIKEKKAHVDQINRKIEAYKQAIERKQAEAASLRGEVDLLENRVAKTELEIVAAQESVRAVDAEIRLLQAQIGEAEEKLKQQRDLIASLVREIDRSDRQPMLALVFGVGTFSDIFGEIQRLELLDADLHDTLTSAEAEKEQLVGFQTEQEGKRASIETWKKTLEAKQGQLEQERESKDVLLDQTQASETAFAMLLRDLKEEEQDVTNQAAALQQTLEEKLRERDTGESGSSILSWPFEPKKGISATFHDPTYPFRNLFEHPGIDLPTPVGTPVGSAAPGYVAWVKQGKMYGNYVMVVHANGLATLYAHLSKILVEPEQFVGRGEAVGLSGGKPGSPGAGLSTGAHLHFEARKNGIPTDPMKYLASD